MNPNFQSQQQQAEAGFRFLGIDFHLPIEVSVEEDQEFLCTRIRIISWILPALQIKFYTRKK